MVHLPEMTITTAAVAPPPHADFGSAWLRLFRYVAKMAAVEYGECPSNHTSRLARFEYGIRVLEGYFFSPGPNWNVLRTQILSAQYGQYGYWNTALVNWNSFSRQF